MLCEEGAASMLTLDQYQAWLEAQPEDAWWHNAEGLTEAAEATITDWRGWHTMPPWAWQLAALHDQERGNVTKACALALLAEARRGAETDGGF
jgi:hypothetical protein